MKTPLLLQTVFLLAGSALGLTAPQPAVITQAHKSVSLASGKALAIGDVMPARQTLFTGQGSRAEVKLGSGATTRIGQGSCVALDDSMISLRAGSALLHPAGKKVTLKTPALTCTAATGVLSVHAAKNYEACFVLDGSGSVNGVMLGAGQALVLENGKSRMIAFDVRRMLATSALVKKFDSAPWMTRALASAALQHQQLAANRAEAARLAGREQQVVAASNARPGSTSANTSNAGFLAGLFGHRVAANDTARLSRVVSLPIASSGAASTVSAGTFRLNGASTYAGATIINAGGLVKTGAGTTTLNSGTSILANPNLVVTGGNVGTTVPNLGSGTAIQVLNGGVAGTTQISPGTLTILPPTINAGTLTTAPSNGASAAIQGGNLLLRNGNAHP